MSTQASWDEAPLSALCRAVGGGTPPRNNSGYWQGSIPWASVKDFPEDSIYLRDTEEHISVEGLRNSASNLIPANTPLVCTRMAVGRCALSTVPTAINQDVKALIDLSAVGPAFFIRALALRGLELDRVAIGSTVKGISTNQLLSLRLRYPSVDEQARITAVLDTVDDAIEQTEALIGKLREVRAGLLHDLLHGGLDEHGQPRDPITHPELFYDTQAGRVPLGWEVTRLGSLAQFVTSGSRGWASHYSDQGALFLRIGNLTREHINLRLDDIVRVQPPPGTEGARTRVKPGDVLISITADLGIVGVIPEPFEEAYVNQHIALVRPIQTVCSRWIGRYLSFGPSAMHIRMLNDSGAKAGMNLPAVESLVIALPPREEQAQVTVVLDAVDAEISGQTCTLSKLRELKYGLMEDLLTGRVRVSAKMELV